MLRYIFTCEHNEEKDFSKHSIEFRADTLTAVLEQFDMFLRGNGFRYDGVVDIVDNREDLENNEGEDLALSKSRWAAVIHSFTNPPKFRANSCEVCGLDKNMMKSHNCYDDNCPVHAPKEKIAASN